METIYLIKPQIDPELKNLIPPLSAEEYSELEKSILKEGCRDSICTWNNTVVDGHNRLAICLKHNLPFNIKEMKFESKDDAIDWMYSNQLARRNLTDPQRTYIMGKQQEARVKRKEDNLKQNLPKPHFEASGKTAEIIAKEQNVSRATVERAAEYSRAIDTITKNTGIDTIKQKILTGDVKTTKEGIVTLSKAPVEIQKKTMEVLNSGQAKGLQDAKRIIAASQVKDIPVVTGKYKVILADPPWQYGGSMNTTYGTADKHYPTMSLDEICNLPIRDLSEDNAVLFLWTTSPVLEESFKVINSWGFKYKASFIWDKIKHVMGHYNSVRHEFLLVATRGSCTPEVMKLFDSVVSEERLEHSEKPETFRKIIDTIYPSGKRIELFARNKAENWEVWGNQI